MSHGFPPTIPSVYTQSSETPETKPQVSDLIKTEVKVMTDVKKKPYVRSVDKRKWRLGKAKLYRGRFRRPEIELLSSQREMNARLKALNSNITSVGNTLNENILGLKRAVETMVSIMLQNKPAQ